MLYSVDNARVIKNIPHSSDYKRWRKQLTDQEYKDIYDELTSRICGSEIQTSSWVPGSDWTGTVFQSIYEKACNHDKNASARFFGLILWHAVMKHKEWWSFGRFNLNNIPIEGLTYFRIDNPN